MLIIPSSGRICAICFKPPAVAQLLAMVIATVTGKGKGKDHPRTGHENPGGE